MVTVRSDATFRGRLCSWDDFFISQTGSYFLDQSPFGVSKKHFERTMKIVNIFRPLQVSLGRMIIDIIKFFFIYTLVLFAFGCGLNQLMWYYADLEKNKCYHLPNGQPDFENNEKACAIWRRFAKYVIQTEFSISI